MDYFKNIIVFGGGGGGGDNLVLTVVVSFLIMIIFGVLIEFDKFSPKSPKNFTK